jgi:hypothetical protein
MSPRRRVKKQKMLRPIAIIATIATLAGSGTAALETPYNGNPL